MPVAKRQVTPGTLDAWQAFVWRRPAAVGTLSL